MTVPPNTEASDALAQTEEAAPAPASSSGDAPKQRMPLVWIPATLGLGLLIAGVYLGGRILTAHSQTKSTVESPVPAQAPVPVQAPQPVVTKPAAAPLQSSPQPAAEAPKLVTDEQVPMIAPQSGERYLQIGALNLEETRRFVGQLRKAEFEPHVAPGPKAELLRVLIGPFADQDSLASARNKLASAGIENFVRKY